MAMTRRKERQRLKLRTPDPLELVSVADIDRPFTTIEIVPLMSNSGLWKLPRYLLAVVLNTSAVCVTLPDCVAHEPLS
jgi:hypothetical protein